MADTSAKDNEVIARAKERFKRCSEWESGTRQRFTDDIKFLFADPDNHDQWNASVRAQRQLDGRPMLTINKTHTHWLHVVNDGKENKPSVKVHPTGDQSSYEAAQVFEGVIRHIEYISDAQNAYDTASEFQVGGGIGYWRIVTDYTDENGFDQEIFIRPVPDPLSVYLEPCKQRDGSDATYGFIYDDWTREKFERKYPDAAASNVVLGNADADGWIGKDKVRVAEYYEVEETKEWMFAIPNEETDDVQFVRESQLSRAEVKMLTRAGDTIQKRKVAKRVVKWYLIAGNAVVDRAIWAGKYIPIIRVIGEEVTMGGKLDRKGLVRYMKDAQRMYNYNSSAQIEYGALQSKTPYVGPLEAFEGLENYWSTANTQNHAYLPYNNADENNMPVQAPTRQEPPTAATAYSQGMAAAAQEMMMTSGQYEATFAEQGNEISGLALEKRQHQGQRATFHFIDGLAKAIRFTGKQLIDLIPKIYDTKRVIRILAEDGEEQQIQIDPEQQQAVQQQKDQENNIVKTIFNPSVGTFDVVAEVGPNFNTKRQEAFQAMKELIIGNPALAQVIGDLWMGNGDFPAADKIAERMRNWIPKEIQGVGPTPQEQKLMQDNQQLMQMVEQLMQEVQSKGNAETLAKQQIDMDGLNHLAIRMENDRKSTIDAFKAETERLKSTMPAMTPAEMDAIIRKQLFEILQAPDLLVGNDLGELTSADAMAVGMSGTTLGEPLSQNPVQLQPEQEQQQLMQQPPTGFPG